MGFCRKIGVDSDQFDVGIEMLGRLLSRQGVDRLEKALVKCSNPEQRLFDHRLQYFMTYTDHIRDAIDVVMEFLRGKNEAIAHKIARFSLFPESPSFAALRQAPSFSRHLEHATAEAMALSIATDLVTQVMAAAGFCDSSFDLAAYGTSLVRRDPTFNSVSARLDAWTLFDELIEEIVAERLAAFLPDVVGISVPFDQNVFGAFRIAQVVKKILPKTAVVLGGGYCNTELRALSDPRVFDHVDYLCLDDGERPLLSLFEHLEGKRPKERLRRTFVREDGKVRFIDDNADHDIPQHNTGTPVTRGLPLDRYFRLPTHGAQFSLLARFVSMNQFNKATLAHGCYWRQCTFCDVHLDYVGRYEQPGIDVIAGRIDALIAENGRRAFHFVDEACPPVVLAGLTKRLIERGVHVAWYGNIRFDKAFNRALAERMAKSGCVAVTGGLEVASDRILKLMKKGTTVKQVVQVANALSQAGIYVHGYLMYGYPTQTFQEIVDSLEVVRQLFAAGCLHSGFWHRFTPTRHSPIGRNPSAFGLTELTQPHPERARFSDYLVPTYDPLASLYTAVEGPLGAALGAYMLGHDMDRPVTEWFGDVIAPATTVSPTLIRDALSPDTDSAQTAGIGIPEDSRGTSQGMGA